MPHHPPANREPELDLFDRMVAGRTGERISIQTIGDLVQRNEKDMLDIENFGRKSLEELKKVLEDVGLSLGMDVSSLPIVEHEPEQEKE